MVLRRFGAALWQAGVRLCTAGPTTVSARFVRDFMVLHRFGMVDLCAAWLVYTVGLTTVSARFARDFRVLCRFELLTALTWRALDGADDACT